MKKKILTLFLSLILVCTTLLLNSCFLLDGAFDASLNTGSGNTGADSIINVQGGDNYDININSGEGNNILAASKALLSAVSVWATFECYQYSWTGQIAGTTQKTGAGAGVIYELDKERGDAYILTNYHVVYESTSVEKNGISSDIKLFLYGQEVTDYAISATYVGGSMQYDLALLKVTGSKVLMESSAVAVDFADSDDIAVLETAIAIGNPEGEGISATVGHVNVDSEYIDMLASDNATTIKMRVIRIDTAVNSGNSGGGLFNSKGELIGIVNAKIVNSSIDNIGYAIPSNVARGVAENIKAHCVGTDKECVYKCMIGVTAVAVDQKAVFDAETGKVHKVETIGVEKISEGSIVTGVIEIGDILNSITIDGVTYEITRLYHLIDRMLYARIGSTIVMSITRGEETFDVTITAEEKMFVDYK